MLKRVAPEIVETSPTVATLGDLAKLANYSLMDTLNCDPDAKVNGVDHAPRQVFTGHYVPVNRVPPVNLPELRCDRRYRRLAMK